MSELEPSAEHPVRGRGDGREGYWVESDPVDVFASDIAESMRRLRVEYVALRAERDGLRLALDGTRAKLAIAHEQLAAAGPVSSTVRELRAVVAELRGSMQRLPAAPPDPPEIEPPLMAVEQLRAARFRPPFDSASALVPVPTVPAEAASAGTRGIEPEPVAPARTDDAHQLDRVVQPREVALRWDPDAAPVVAARFATSDDRSRESTRLGRAHQWQALDWRTVVAHWKRVAAAAASVAVLVLVLVLAVTIGPRLLPYEVFYVESSDMEPAIDTGSVAFFTKIDGTALGVDDIITFKSPDDGQEVTRRVVAFDFDADGSRWFATQGDANRRPDPWRVPGDETSWRYRFAIPYLGYLAGALGSVPAPLVLVLLPAVVIAALRARERRRPSPIAAHAEPDTRERAPA